MNFTIQNLLNSLAGVLKTGYPDRPVYTSPNQQGISMLFYLSDAVQY